MRGVSKSLQTSRFFSDVKNDDTSKSLNGPAPLRRLLSEVEALFIQSSKSVRMTAAKDRKKAAMNFLSNSEAAAQVFRKHHLDRRTGAEELGIPLGGLSFNKYGAWRVGCAMGVISSLMIMLIAYGVYVFGTNVDIKMVQPSSMPTQRPILLGEEDPGPNSLCCLESRPCCYAPYQSESVQKKTNLSLSLQTIQFALFRLTGIMVFYSWIWTASLAFSAAAKIDYPSILRFNTAKIQFLATSFFEGLCWFSALWLVSLLLYFSMLALGIGDLQHL